MPRKFSFLSPGVQLNEIDESFITPEVEADGIMIIGTAPKGPGLEPVVVRDKETMTTLFGKARKQGSSTEVGSVDAWRDGTQSLSDYGLMAAEMHFESNVGTPVKFVRLVGEKDGNVNSDAYSAGWNLGEAGNANAAANDNITAYGLWVITEQTFTDTGNADDSSASGSLAAIFYVSGAALHLSGTVSGLSNQQAANHTADKGVGVARKCGAGNVYNISVYTEEGGTSSVVETVTTDFKSRGAIGDFNTNPEQLRAAANFGGSSKKYFLGETFELKTKDYTSTNTTLGSQAAILFPLQTAGGLNWADRKKDAKASESPWFIDRQPTQRKLFKLVSLHKGESFHKEFYPTIENLYLGQDAIDPSRFTVKIKRLSDNAEMMVANCSLDPAREDFIGKVIGTQYQQWDATQKKYNIRGEYPVLNEYVRVVLADDVKNGTLNDPLALPVGFYGPAKPKKISITSVANGTGTISSNAFIVNPNSVPGGHNIAASGGMVGTSRLTLEWPTLRLTTNTSAYSKNDLQGVDHCESPKQAISPCYYDIVRALPGNNSVNLDEHADSLHATLERSFIFSLDEIKSQQNDSYFHFESGSYSVSEDSISKLSGSVSAVLDLGVKQYKAYFHGGFDGLDIKNANPFSNTIMSGKSEATSYAYNSIKKAISTISDPEVTQYDILAVPGITNTGLTDDIVELANKRKDFLYIMDIPSIYLPTWENSGVESYGTLSSIVSTFKSRKVDSSYAATYYPWVRYNDHGLVPPSVAAVQALGFSEAQSQPWFAPAGFNRGSLKGAANTSEHLTKANRDDLYQARINPIAKFPAVSEIVVFGQKTLQRKPSALDRINVRRLLIYLKRRIGVIADTILFDQNVQSTWGRFKTQAEAVLDNVKTNLGITEYKLVLDETTTTADLIDRNVMYAKIYIKPARAIEFIVVDFVITKSGVEF